MTAPTDLRATAADSGRSATAAFAATDRGRSAAADPERVAAVAGAALAALHDVVRAHRLTYAEYDALKAWLIRVGEDGEWPLLLDVFLEHVVEEVAHADRAGAVGTIEGPYYRPGAPERTGEATLPVREDEPGTPLVLHGTVTDLEGHPLDGAVVDVWHADDEGLYSQFAPGIPEWNLRGRIRTGADGRYTVRTVRPAPYRIPTDGATGALLAAAGWHPWRPAHVHVKVSAPGRAPVTTQLYFTGGEWLDDDVARAVKPELVLHPAPAAAGEGEEVRHDFALDAAR